MTSTTVHLNSSDYAARLHLVPTDVVYDIGANAGHVTQILAGAAAKVFAFEPNADVIAPLLARGLMNVTVVHQAVSNKIGNATFHVDVRPDTGAVASSLMRLTGLEDQTRSITVQTTTVDAFSRLTRTVPDFIKIDVEGFEPQVIEGAERTISRRRPIIIFELWETHWDRFGPTVERLQKDYHLVRLSTGEAAIP